MVMEMRDKYIDTQQVNEKSIRKFPITELIAAFICNLGGFNCGLGVGWLSPALPQMYAEGGILSSLDPDDASTAESWMAGAFALSALIFTPVTAIISEAWGRKTCGIIAGIPFAINGIIVIVSSDINMILIGRGIMGIGISLANGNMQSYVGEIASPAVRGQLGSFLILLNTFGITTSYLIGGFISYVAGAEFILTVAVLSSVLFCFVPETPAWLVKNGDDKKAIDSIAWLRRREPNDPAVLKELQKFQEDAKVENPSRLQAAKQLILSKPQRRGFLICSFMILFQACSGMSAIHSYSVSIFLSSGAANLSAEGAASIYGCLQILGALSTTFLVDRFGRKVLMAWSTLGLFTCMTTMGIYFHLQSLAYDLESLQWIPVLALSLCVYTYTVGAGNIPFILIADMLRNEVRSIATMFLMIIFNFTIMMILLFFSKAVNAFGDHVVFYFFSVVSAFGFFMTFLILPETKGKTTEEIQQILSK